MVKWEGEIVESVLEIEKILYFLYECRLSGSGGGGGVEDGILFLAFLRPFLNK